MAENTLENIEKEKGSKFMSAETKALFELEKRFDKFTEQTGTKPNADQIDAQIRKYAMEKYGLGITNFYRLHAYFVDEYLKKKTEPEYELGVDVDTSKQRKKENPPDDLPKKKGFLGISFNNKTD
jgi:alpha-galactosidase/6-phospho-beta-glucosidase family protein